MPRLQPCETIDEIADSLIRSFTDALYAVMPPLLCRFADSSRFGRRSSLEPLRLTLQCFLLISDMKTAAGTATRKFCFTHFLSRC